MIHLDGDEVHFSDLKGFSIIQRKFEAAGLQFEILACRTAPNKADRDFLCYECIINGQAFSQLPNMSENRLLMTTEDSPQPVIDDGDNYSSEEEENDETASYYDNDLCSVVDIVYPDGIPAPN
jgi:hypothetical protein